MTSSRAWGNPLLAVALNALVVGPALLLSDAGALSSALFFALVSAFAWLEARGGQALDLADGGFPWAALATAQATLGLFWLAALSAPAHASALALIVGAGAMALGVTLRHLAMRALGRGFVSEVKVAPRLVEGGIYQRMRHPSEAGLLALTLGAAVLFESVAGLIAWALVFVPLVCWRVWAEDRELRLCFGTAHADYCRKVGAFW